MSSLTPERNGVATVRALLAEALYKGSVEEVKKLLDSGIVCADVAFYDLTILSYAMRYALNKYSAELIELLLNAGADVDASDILGVTALMHSVSRIPRTIIEKVVRILVAAAADLNVRDDCSGYTALMYAIEYSDVRSERNIIKLLLEANADVSIKNNRGRTALRNAVEDARGISTTFLITMLIESIY